MGGLDFNKETSILDAIVELTKLSIKLYIWEIDKEADIENRVKIVYQHGNPEGTPNHIFHAKGLDSHFELMAEANLTLEENKKFSPKPLISKLNIFSKSKDLNEIEFKQQYFYLLENKMSEMDSVALPESKINDEQIIEYLKQRTSAHVVISDYILKLYEDRLAFPLEEFFIKFCANSTKTHFIMLMVNESHRYGLIIHRNEEGEFVYEYFSPAEQYNPHVSSDENIKITLKLFQLQNEIKLIFSQILSSMEGADYYNKAKGIVIQNNIVTNLKEFFKIEKIENPIIICSSQKQQIIDSDFGYIVAQNLYEKVEGALPLVPSLELKQPMKSIEAIAQLRQLFCDEKIMGINNAKKNIYMGFAQRLAVTFLENPCEDIQLLLTDYMKNLGENNKDKGILEALQPILEKIISKDFTNDKNLEMKDFITMLLQEAILSFTPKELLQFCKKILQPHVGKDGSVNFVIAKLQFQIHHEQSPRFQNL